VGHTPHLQEIIVLRLVPVLLAAGALAVAGCGSSNNNSSSNSTSNATSSPSTANGGANATPAPQGTGGASSSKPITIDMKNIQFSPADVTAKVGQKIKWVNEDAVDHNVVATSGGSFKSSNFGKGATFETTLKKAGTIKYVCTIHPGMDGTITVTK
jgi:plastocyanin